MHEVAFLKQNKFLKNSISITTLPYASKQTINLMTLSVLFTAVISAPEWHLAQTRDPHRSAKSINEYEKERHCAMTGKLK